MSQSDFWPVAANFPDLVLFLLTFALKLFEREREREKIDGRKNPKRRAGPLALAVENLTSMSIFGSDCESFL